MDKLTLSLLLITILLVFYSCVEFSDAKVQNTLLENEERLLSDTLIFTSGTRAIFQDTKDNYCLDSHREGVCRYDGQSFQYFTTTEGLSDNHVYAIQEDSFNKHSFDKWL